MVGYFLVRQDKNIGFRSDVTSDIDASWIHNLHTINPLTMEREVLASHLPEGWFQFTPDEKTLIYTLTTEGRKKDPQVYDVKEPEDRQPGWRERSNLAKYDLASGILQPLTFGYHNIYLMDISADSRYLLIGKGSVKSHGDVAFSVGMTCASTILAPVMTPLLMKITAGEIIHVDAVGMFINILIVTIIPVAIGCALNYIYGKKDCFPIRVATSAERYCGGEQKWWQRYNRYLFRVRQPQPDISSRGHHQCSGRWFRQRILLLTSSLPAKAMDACYSDIQHTPVILVEIDISLRIEDVEFCSKHQFDSIELAWNTMKVSEIDRITGTRDIGTVLCDSQDIQPFLLCCQGHFLQTAEGMT